MLTGLRLTSTTQSPTRGNQGARKKMSKQSKAKQKKGDRRLTEEGGQLKSEAHGPPTNPAHGRGASADGISGRPVLFRALSYNPSRHRCPIRQLHPTLTTGASRQSRQQGARWPWPAGQAFSGGRNLSSPLPRREVWGGPLPIDAAAVVLSM